MIAAEQLWLVKKSDPARTRTWNPLIRSQMPYPLGHRAPHVKGVLDLVLIIVMLLMQRKLTQELLLNVSSYTV